MKNFFSFVAATSISALLVATMPVSAGLGSAAIKGSTKGYDAWCGEKGNDCKVTFTDGKITVNNTDSVDFKNITYITRSIDNINAFWASSVLQTFGIEYLEEGMEQPEFAEIIFQNHGAAEKFWMDLKRACRQCKDRDATQVEVEVDIKE